MRPLEDGRKGNHGYEFLMDARRQKERLVQEFYTRVVQQVNTLIFQVTDKVMESLEKHHGILRGPVSAQLKNLVSHLEALNFVENVQIEDQLQRLRSILPTQEEQEKASKGLAKINTTRIRQVVRAIHGESKQTLVDLGTQPRPRVSRVGSPLSGEQALLDSSRRTSRAGTMSLPSEEAKPSRRTSRTL